MFGIGSRDKFALGFHMESKEFKVVGITGSKKGYYLDFQARYSPDPGGIPTQQQLKDIVNCIGGKKAGIIVSLPGEYILIRHFELPDMSSGDLARTVSWEMKIPLPGEDLVIRALKLERVNKKGKNIINAMGIAVPHSTAKQFYELFISAGIKPEAIEPQPIALWRLLALTKRPVELKDEYYAVVYIGYRTSYLLAMRGNAVVYSRILPLGIDSEYGGPSGFGLVNTEEVLMEISQTLLYFSSLGVNREINKVFVSGEKAPLFPEKYFMYGNLSFNSLEVELTGGEVLSPGYEVAAGLALREVAN